MLPFQHSGPVRITVVIPAENMKQSVKHEKVELLGQLPSSVRGIASRCIPRDDDVPANHAPFPVVRERHDVRGSWIAEIHVMEPRHLGVIDKPDREIPRPSPVLVFKRMLQETACLLRTHPTCIRDDPPVYCHGHIEGRAGISTSHWVRRERTASESLRPSTRPSARFDSNAITLPMSLGPSAPVSDTPCSTNARSS